MSEAEPIAVLRAFDAALNAHDLEAVMDLFAAGATVRYLPPPPPPGRAAYSGKPEIRRLLRVLIADGVAVQARHYEAQGNRAISRGRRMFAARHEQLGGNPIVVDCQAVVHRGRIQSLTITFSPESLRRIQAARAEAPTPPALPQGGG